jgi:Amt family ammonium transporter
LLSTAAARAAEAAPPVIDSGDTAWVLTACTFLKPALGYDDSLDVFGVHALGGAWGALASGLFAVTLGSGIDTNTQQTMVQLTGIAFVALFAPIATAAILGLLGLVFGSLRVSEETEQEGLDLSEHSESAYGLSSGSVVGLESLVEAHGMGIVGHEKGVA